MSYNRAQVLSSSCTFLKCVEEGFQAKLKAYDDGTGCWTIGYGCIYNYDQKRRVRKGDVINQSQAEQYLKLEVLEKLAFIEQQIKGLDLNQNQVVALVSFAFNEGTQALANSSFMRELKKFPLYDAALFRQLYLKWVYAVNEQTHKEEILQGLVNRRNKELALFFSTP